MLDGFTTMVAALTVRPSARNAIKAVAFIIVVHSFFCSDKKRGL
jgi:NaMN:DMB phosphoribosyltransferase